MLPTTTEPPRKPSSHATGLTDSLALSSLLKDREIGDILGKLEAAALDAVSDENYSGAISALKQSEEILEQMSTQGKAPDRDMVICMLNNTACCYQKYPLSRLGALEKCAAYLEACSIYTVSLKSISNRLTEVAETVKRAKQQAMVNVQLCAVLSQLGNHESALEKAKIAVRLSNFCLDCTLHAAKLHHIRYQQTQSKTETLEQTHLFSKRAASMLRSIQDLLKSPTAEPPSRPAQPFAEWVYTLAISDIMFIEPIAVSELKAKSGIRGEFSRDFMLDKVANLAVGYFCVSTEMQFLRGNQAYNPDRDKEAYVSHRESYHMKALRLLEAFFPLECPLLQHVSQTYDKRFISDLHEIPEEVPQATAKTAASRSSRTTRSHSKNPSRESTPTAKLPALRERAKVVPRSPSAAVKRETPRQRGKVVRKASMEIKGKEQEKVKSEGSFGGYPGRRKQGKRLGTRETGDYNRSFDRERRNKSAELMRGPDDSHLEDYLLGVIEGRNHSPSQFIVS